MYIQPYVQVVHMIHTLYELNALSHSCNSSRYFISSVDGLHKSLISLGNDGCRVLGINCSKYGCTIFSIAGLFLAVFSLAKKFS